MFQADTNFGRLGSSCTSPKKRRMLNPHHDPRSKDSRQIPALASVGEGPIATKEDHPYILRNGAPPSSTQASLRENRAPPASTLAHRLAVMHLECGLKGANRLAMTTVGVNCAQQPFPVCCPTPGQRCNGSPPLWQHVEPLGKAKKLTISHNSLRESCNMCKRNA